MKKIYTLVAAFAVVLSANAQTKSNTAVSFPVGHVPTINHSSDRAAGDTVMYFDGNNFYGALPGTFNFALADVDGLTHAGALTGAGWPATGSFLSTYDVIAPGDTNFFLIATSYFTPLAAADNWFTFGPVTIPAAGATLHWKHNMPDEDYRDGYEVLTSLSGLADIADFTDPAIYTVADMDPSTLGDTVNTPNSVFVERNVLLDAGLSGQDVYFAIRHNANDMFLLEIDDVYITEGAVTGVNEFVNGAKFSQNAPNPFGTVTTINYELQNAAKVTLNVYDVTGKKVIEQNQGDLTSGKHSVKVNAENLAAGVYYYSLKVNENVTSSMKMVVVK